MIFGKKVPTAIKATTLTCDEMVSEYGSVLIRVTEKYRDYVGYPISELNAEIALIEFALVNVAGRSSASERGHLQVAFQLLANFVSEPVKSMLSGVTRPIDTSDSRLYEIATQIGELGETHLVAQREAMQRMYSQIARWESWFTTGRFAGRSEGA